MKALTLTLVLLVSCRSDEPGKETGTTETGDTVVDAVDADSDGFDESTDCDDTNADINPSATEICDGIDNNCNGLTDDADEAIEGQQTWNQDIDGDGFGNPDVTQEACEQPSGFTEDATDCNDLDALFHPGADESDCTDERDFNCDGSVGYADEDGDGFAACEECDDTTASSNPLAFEICDGTDNDCDGDTDESDAVDVQAWYADTDGDGYGDASSETVACDAPSGFVADDTDCDDAEASVNESASEVCDSIDNDCDGWVDDDDPDVTGTTTWYGDSDGDGYGGQQYQQEACEMPPGFSANTDDCNDLDAASHPGAVEVCDESDNDCDGTTDEGVLLTWYADSDGDGYGDPTNTTEQCSQPPGYQSNGNDCNDNDASARPGGVELCDGVDNNCDGSTDNGAIDAGTWYADADGDGYGDANNSTTACTQPSNTASTATDCNDADAAIHPTADEVCDSVDNDCDGTSDEPDATDASTWYADTDGDGYGAANNSTTACTQPSNATTDATDCDDTLAAVNPIATEVCDNIDNDCDGTTDEPDATDASTWYADTDGDGYGDPNSTPVTSCAQPSNTSTDSTDCDDTTNTIHPGATETWYDGIDSNCDTASDYDADADGADSADHGGTDCDDTDASASTCGSSATLAGESCLALLTIDSTLTDGTYWLNPDGGSAYEVFCDMTNDGGGWALLAKFTASGSNWNYSDGTWTSTSPLNAADTLDDTTVSDAKSDSWSRLAVSELRLNVLGTNSSSGAYVIFSNPSTTAYDLMNSGTQSISPSAGDITLFSKADSNFQGNAGEGSNTLLVNASTSHSSSYSCCGLNNRVRLGTSCYDDFSSYPHGAANSGYKGIGGTTRYRDGHNASCCNYSEQNESYSNTSGDNLVIWGR